MARNICKICTPAELRACSNAMVVEDKLRTCKQAVLAYLTTKWRRLDKGSEKLPHTSNSAFHKDYVIQNVTP
jgi:hypothetical protein